MPTHLAAFVVTVALLAVLPGANNASITRQTLMYGRRPGLAAVAGASAGIVVWATAAAAGLSAALLANPGAYLVLRLAGAAVLAGLGLQTLLTLGRPASNRRGADADPQTPARFPNQGGFPGAVGLRTLPAPGRSGFVRSRERSGFLVGLLTSLGNPKAGVVAVSLVPQFVTADGPVLLSSIGLGVLWASISAAWFTIYVWLVDRGRARVSRPATQRLVRAVTGVTLVGLGVAVAVAA